MRMMVAFLGGTLLASCAHLTGYSPLPAAARIGASALRVSPGAVTFTVLHNFESGSDGANPYAGLTNVEGTLYGTTSAGGNPSFGVSFGTVYTISTSGIEKVIYAFQNGDDAQFPKANLTSFKGTLYGTTAGGGKHNGSGTVFTVTTGGSETVLHSFDQTDGSQPLAGLTKVNGVLYGTTSTGGSAGVGTVFKITTAGKFALLCSFKGGQDGAEPEAGLTNVSGVLYGTTRTGGSAGFGTVFKITTAGIRNGAAQLRTR